MPLEKTRRWPRTVSLRGRKESSATKLTRKGKPVKLVLAARIRISAVAACRHVEEDAAGGARPVDERRSRTGPSGCPTVKGTAWVKAARTETPRNMAPRMVLMSTSVVRAFVAWGSRKMLTPLEMASVPVMAELAVGEGPQQIEGRDARACSPPLAWPERHRAGVAGARGRGRPWRLLTKPVTIRTAMLAMKK